MAGFTVVLTTSVILGVWMVIQQEEYREGVPKVWVSRPGDEPFSAGMEIVSGQIIINDCPTGT